MTTTPTRRRFTVDEYHCMGDAGILREDERIELIEGDIVLMPPIGSDHMGGVNYLNQLLVLRLGDRAIVSVQNPVRLSSNTEPEPDFTVLKPRADFYRTAIPTAADVLLLIEIARSSLRYDQRIKLPLYAAAGIPEVWIAALPTSRILVHREPSATGYRSITEHQRGDTIAPLAFPDVSVTVDEILG
ncbi:MAG: Uma2 family endonuclease [Chloroflexi bacterium]|nr:Uma2 family endonuclease [Chloroflexota bacterium]